MQTGFGRAGCAFWAFETQVMSRASPFDPRSIFTCPPPQQIPARCFVATDYFAAVPVRMPVWSCVIYPNADFCRGRAWCQTW